jgi:transposase, IS6 family
VINSSPASSAPAGYRFPREVIAVAVRWYLRYGLSYRDVEELLAERSIQVDHVTVYRLGANLHARVHRRATVGAARDRRSLVRRPVDLPLPHDRSTRPSRRRPGLATPRCPCCTRILHPHAQPRFVAGRGYDRPGSGLPRVVDELSPAARHVLEQYANNSVEADHGRLKARLRPMRGLKTISSLRTVAAGHAFVQNLRRCHYEITADLPAHARVRVAFTALAPRL